MLKCVCDAGSGWTGEDLAMLTKMYGNLFQQRQRPPMAYNMDDNACFRLVRWVASINSEASTFSVIYSCLLLHETELNAVWEGLI